MRVESRATNPTNQGLPTTSDHWWVPCHVVEGTTLSKMQEVPLKSLKNFQTLTKLKTSHNPDSFQPESLSTRVFETWMETRSELFSLLTHNHIYIAKYLFSNRDDGIRIWETPLSWHAKCSLPVASQVSKTCVLKLPTINQYTTWK